MNGIWRKYAVAAVVAVAAISILVPGAVAAESTPTQIAQTQTAPSQGSDPNVAEDGGLLLERPDSSSDGSGSGGVVIGIGAVLALLGIGAVVILKNRRTPAQIQSNS